MAKEAIYPVWSEREQPTTYLIDQHEPGRDYSRLPESDDGQNDDYLEWINEYKEPLHDSLRIAHPNTVERLDRRGINLQEIGEFVAHITDRPAYPLERVVTAHDLRAAPDYTEAARDGFFSKAMNFGDNKIAYGQFEYILHFIRLRQTYVNRAAKNDVVDTAAHVLGLATLSPVTYVHLDRLDGGNKVYHWFGYAWRYQDRYFGELLDHASAAKIAALTRRELDYRTSTQSDAASSPTEDYRERRGFNYAAPGAIALDLINKAAGNSDELAIYRPLWGFISGVQDPAARQELDAIIRRATDSQITVETLESAPFSTNGLSLRTLRKIEEACEIESSRRPSRLIRAVGVM